MFCTSCGSEIEEGAAFCTNCGSKTQKIPTQQASASSSNVPDTSGIDVSAYPTVAQGSVGAPNYPQTTAMPTVGAAGQAYVASQPQSQGSKPNTTMIISIAAIAVAVIAIIVLIVALVSGGSEDAVDASSQGYESTSEQQLNDSMNNSAEETSIEEVTAPEFNSSSAAWDVINSPNGYILEDSDVRFYSDAELNALSDYELYLARNEIYARYGREFKNRDLQDYFWNKNWYTPRYSPESFDNIVTLNKYEKKNAQAMLALEKARGSAYLQ